MFFKIVILVACGLFVRIKAQQDFVDGTVKNYGEKCSNSSNCNQDKFLSCENGTCDCNLTTSVFNPTELFPSVDPNIYVPANDTCVGRIGSSCDFSHKKYCTHNANCEHGVCVCASLFVPTSDMLCGLKYNKTCSRITSTIDDSGFICSDQFVCTGDANGLSDGEKVVTAVCECRNPGFEYFDTRTESCRAKVGFLCNSSQSSTCVGGASCVDKNGVYQCECDTGYIVTKTWMCQLSYGEPCHYSSRYIRVHKDETCDEGPSLKCINGKCSCPNEIDVYEGERRRCSTPVGFPCKETLGCVSKADCTANSTGSDYPGRCTCQRNHIQTNRSCGKE